MNSWLNLKIGEYVQTLILNQSNNTWENDLNYLSVGATSCFEFGLKSKISCQCKRLSVWQNPMSE